MSTAEDPPITPDEAAPEEAFDETADGDDSLRALLRGALAAADPEPPDMLRGVQRKIRERTRGRFFSDGWSTERHPPINTYLVTSLVMLAIVLAAWAVLSPLSGEPAPVAPPAPVNVIPSPGQRGP